VEKKLASWKQGSKAANWKNNMTEKCHLLPACENVIWYTIFLDAI
jgi:hypothetical protein